MDIKKHKIGLLLMVVFIVVSLTANVYGRTDCSGDKICKCGDFILNGGLKELDYNLVDCPRGGLTINADRVTLNCNNHFISGSGLSEGIKIVGNSQVTIQNCRISNFNKGIKVDRGVLNSLDSNIIYNNQRGIYASSIVSLDITNNLVCENQEDYYCTSPTDQTVIGGSGNQFDNIESCGDWPDEENYSACEDLPLLEGDSNGNDCYDYGDNFVSLLPNKLREGVLNSFVWNIFNNWCVEE
jgi:hypothetical protein